MQLCFIFMLFRTFLHQSLLISMFEVVMMNEISLILLQVRFFSLCFSHQSDSFTSPLCFLSSAPQWTRGLVFYWLFPQHAGHMTLTQCLWVEADTSTDLLFSNWTDFKRFQMILVHSVIRSILAVSPINTCGRRSNFLQKQTGLLIVWTWKLSQSDCQLTDMTLKDL